MAVNAGASAEQVDKLPNWEAVSEFITSNQGGGEAAEGEAEAEAEAEPEPINPKKGEMYKYQVLDAKTKKPLMNMKVKPPKPLAPVDVEVTLVNTKSKTVDLKNVDDGKTIYKTVPFDQLISH
jgi:hypothetical protein